jgi:hypothetical protein
MLKKTLVGVGAVLGVIVIGFVGLAAMQSSDFRVTRSLAMKAPPSTVFQQINDFHAWEAWSPWAKLDPAAKTTFDGPTSGEGASFAWSGNDKVGEGRQTILKSQPDELVQIKLDFERPFKDTCTSEFTVKPDADQTLVTWSMYGKRGFVGKCMGLIIDCDKIIGPDFEKGLASMKAIVESASRTGEASPKTEENAVTK